METSNKKSLKWLWIAIAVLAVVGVVVWCVLSAINNPKSNKEGVENIFNLTTTIVLFVTAFLIIAIGYLVGGIEIKGVSLGTAGVFLVAILFGFLCTLIPNDLPLLGSFSIKDTSDKIVDYLSGPLQNVGLVLFVGAVGFIAGPNFFSDLAKNFKTYIVLGSIIILSGAGVTVLFALIKPEYGPEFWSGILSGALTSTPGFSAAVDAADPTLKAVISLGYAIAYPFGVVGVVLFVQLLPKILKVDMEKERQLLKIGDEKVKKDLSKFFKCEPFGLMPFGLAIIFGLFLGSVTIPLSASGYQGPCFSLGTTGGVLIMCLIFGHLGHIGKLSLEVADSTKKILREFGLALFLLGAGFDGGVSLVEQISKFGGDIVIWGFLGGAIITLVPMIVGFVIAKIFMKLPLLNTLGSITGGMTSTPALGTLIHTAKTEDVASAYASTYPIALVLVVLACQLIITLL